MSAIIDVEPTHLTANGQRYRVWHNGAVLIESTKDPFFDAARELVKVGVTGRVQKRRLGSTKIDMTGLIAVAATLQATEGVNGGPRIRKWSPHFMEASR